MITESFRMRKFKISCCEGGNELGLLRIFTGGYIANSSRVDVFLHLQLLWSEKLCCGGLKFTWTWLHIHEGTRMDCWHEHLCRRIIEITTVFWHRVIVQGEKILHFEESPNLGICTLVSMVIETKVVIGWFKPHLKCDWLILTTSLNVIGLLNCPITNCPITRCPITRCPITNCPITAWQVN